MPFRTGSARQCGGKAFTSRSGAKLVAQCSVLGSRCTLEPVREEFSCCLSIVATVGQIVICGIAHGRRECWDAGSAESLAAKNAVFWRRRLGLCESFATGTITDFLPLGLEVVPIGRRQGWDWRAGHAFASSQLPFMVGRGWNCCRCSAKAMRHSDIRTTMNIYGDVVTDEMERAHSRVVALALDRREIAN